MRSHRLFASLAVAALAATSAAPASATNLVSNGGFESPDVGSWVLKNPGDTSITGWTVVGNTISFQDSAAFGGLGVVASEGSQFLELSGVVGRGGGVRSDPFTTQAGSRYVLQFDIGAFFVGGQGSYGNVTVDLWIDGIARGSFTNTLGLTGPGSDWETAALDFVAAGATTTLEFRSSLSTTSSDLGVGLDNINVNLNPPTSAPGTVPEPSSALLLAAGIGAAGALRRSRR
jgi:hypothetical protein